MAELVALVAVAVVLAQVLAALEFVALAVLVAVGQGLAFYEYLRADRARAAVGQGRR